MTKRLASLLAMLAIAATLAIGGASTAAANPTTDRPVDAASQCSGDKPVHPDCFVVFVDKVDGKNAYFAVGSYLGGRSPGSITVTLEYKSTVKTASKVCVIGQTCSTNTSSVAKSGSGDQYMCAKIYLKGGGGPGGNVGPFHKCRVV